jgi:hypothetical protein
MQTYTVREALLLLNFRQAKPPPSNTKLRLVFKPKGTGVAPEVNSKLPPLIADKACAGRVILRDEIVALTRANPVTARVLPIMGGVKVFIVGEYKTL